jgi:hypothetical protein
MLDGAFYWALKKLKMGRGGILESSAQPRFPELQKRCGNDRPSPGV